MWTRLILVSLVLAWGPGCSEDSSSDGSTGGPDTDQGMAGDVGSSAGEIDAASNGRDASALPDRGPMVEADMTIDADAVVAPDMTMAVDATVAVDMATAADATVAVDAGAVPENPLEALFAPPTPAELQAIRAEWATWDVAVNDWAVLGEGMLRGFRFVVVSHRVDGNLHYGAVRYPAEYDPDGSYPVLVVNHGGGNGVATNVFNGYANGCYGSFFIVAASFRSEELRTGNAGLGDLVSEGVSSVVDRDVSDVIALLSGVLENMPGADPQRVAAHGGSRGAGVTALLSIRDSRIRRAGVYYGATNHIHPDVRDAVLRAVEMNRPAGNPVNQTAMRKVQAFIDGDLTFAEARQALVRGSAVFFAEDLPRPYHHHHGTDDRAVPIAQGRALATRMAELGVGAPDFEFTEYEGGEHNPRSMPGSSDAIRALLCGILD